MHDAVSAGWDKLGEDWGNQARHDALRALAVEQGELKWLATKYREKAGDPIADAQLAKIASVAMATFMTRATAAKHGADSNAPYKRALLWIGVLVVMLIMGLVAAKLMTTMHHPRAG